MIFITGCARSGTSLTAKILQRLGCSLGPVNSLYENLSVREGILKPYLRSIGADPLGQKTLPDTTRLISIADLKCRIENEIPGPEPRAYKDAKLVLVWPIFHAAFPDAVWVIVRRDAEAIADSCMRTNFMRAYQTKEQWLGWVHEYETRMEIMRRMLNVVETWPDKYIKDPAKFKNVASKCGLEFSEEIVANCIDNRAWTQSGAPLSQVT